LNAAVDRLEKDMDGFRPELIRAEAEKFSKDRFLESFQVMFDGGIAKNH